MQTLKGPGAKEDSSYGYVIAAAGFGVWLIAWGTSATFGIFFRPISTEFGWTRADTALAYSLGSVVMAFVAIAMGWLTDKLGPRLVVTIFGSFLGISYLLMSRVTTLWQFQLNYALIAAIGLSTATTPIMATVTRWFVKRRGLMIGLVQAGLGIGGLICAPLAGRLISDYGWRTAYVILGIITFGGIVLSGLFLRRSPRRAMNSPSRPKGGEALEKGTDFRRGGETGLSLGEAVRTKAFWIIAGLHFSFGFCRSAFMTHTAPHVQDLGFSLVDGANVIAVLTLSSMSGRIAMGRVADQIGNGPAFMMSYLVTTISLTWVLITQELWGLYLFACVFGFGWGAQAVLRIAVTSEAFGLVSIGFVMGVLGIAEAGASAVGSYFVGYLFDVTGTYRGAFGIGIAVSLMGIALAWLFRSAQTCSESPDQ